MERRVKRDLGIIVLRTLAMSMIVLCHLCSFFSTPSFLPQFLNVGVYVFLIISGWLYGGKEISEPTSWLFRRWKKIYIPILLWLSLVGILSLILYHQKIAQKDLLLLVFNLQGLSWIIPSFPQLSGEGLVAGLGHLWFITVLFCCYTMLCFRIVKENSLISFLVSLVISIILGLFGINLFCLSCFLLGCSLKKIRFTKRELTIVTFLMILSVLVRLVGKRYLDGTVYYDVIIVGIAQILLSMGLFVIIKDIVDSSALAQRIANSWLVLKGDRLSYHIYITHYLFLCPLFGLTSFVPSPVLQVVVFIVLSLFSAVLLKWISDIILKRLNYSSTQNT